jgi:hypothetical protein
VIAALGIFDLEGKLKRAAPMVAINDVAIGTKIP